ncbi:MAG TPA: hypothetical protein PL188_11360, partial [Candidatus Cloacimonadota bacterium]|nr:hypothetical protein [Candidatus Cloacimonadota bacterium]
ETGRVYILAGNANLHETTVANANETIPVPDPNIWRIEVYPNPITSHGSGFNVVFKGTGFESKGSYSMELYNIKGQRFLSQAIPMDNLAEGCQILGSDTWSKGILLLSISKDGVQVISKKLTYY